MTLMEWICNIFCCYVAEDIDDVEQLSRHDDRPHVSFDLENNVYYEGLAVHSKVLVNPKSSFDSVDLTGIREVEESDTE